MRRLVLILILLLNFALVTAPARAQTSTPTPTPSPLQIIAYDLQYDNCAPGCVRSPGTDLSPTDGLWQDTFGGSFGQILLPPGIVITRVTVTGYSSFMIGGSCHAVTVLVIYNPAGYGGSDSCVTIGDYFEFSEDVPHIAVSGWVGIFFYGARAKSVTIYVGDPYTPTPFTQGTLAPFQTATAMSGCFLNYCDLIATPTLPPTLAGTPMLIAMNRTQQVMIAQNAINMYRTMDSSHIWAAILTFSFGAVLLVLFVRMVLKMLEVGVVRTAGSKELRDPQRRGKK